MEERVRLGPVPEDLFHRLNVIRCACCRPRAARGHPTLAGTSSPVGPGTRRRGQAPLGGDPTCRALDFPGNVRQLENLCHWLTVMAPGQTVEVADLPPGARIDRTRASSWPTGGEALMAEASTGLAQSPGEALTRSTATSSASQGFDPARPQRHRRAAHRGGPAARHRPQHHHPQDPGARPRGARSRPDRLAAATARPSLRVMPARLLLGRSCAAGPMPGRVVLGKTRFPAPPASPPIGDFVPLRRVRRTWTIPNPCHTPGRGGCRAAAWPQPSP